MPFCLNSGLFPKNNVPESEAQDSEILTICLCVFFENALILNKRLIPGQPPSKDLNSVTFRHSRAGGNPSYYNWQP